jgi:predicted amidophosphoribosyltransferase
MPLPVVSFSTYLTTTESVTWRSDDYNARDFVLAVKGREIAGYAFVRCRGAWRRFDNASRQDVVRWFGEMVAEYAEREPLPSPFVLVPVPGSQTDLQFCGISRSTLLATAIANAVSPAPTVRDVLRWEMPIVSSRLMAGTRDVGALYRRLRVIACVEGEHVVLVDDVLTLGGHLRACAAKLRAHGANVVLGLCAGRADQMQVPDPFGVRSEQLEDFVP